MPLFRGLVIHNVEVARYFVVSTHTLIGMNDSRREPRRMRSPKDLPNPKPWGRPSHDPAVLPVAANEVEPTAMEYSAAGHGATPGTMGHRPVVPQGPVRRGPRLLRGGTHPAGDNPDLERQRLGAMVPGRSTRGAGSSRRGMPGGEGPFPLVVCQDRRLMDIVMSAAASCGTDPRFVREPDDIRRWWARASTVLVGVEMAPVVAGLGLAPRTAVHLMAADAAEVTAWSVPLSAAVLVLPDQAGCLPAVLGQADPGPGGRATVIDVMGGSGGVGATTLAAALAQRCSARNARSALIDLDPCGGGVDLMFGAEREPGWRWDDLTSVSGTVNDIAARLPRVGGFPVLSMGRAGADHAGPQLPGAAAVRAVLDSMCRNLDVVVLDDPNPQNWPGAENATRVVVVAGHVRAVMAARARTLQHSWGDAQVVVRTGPGMGLDPRAVADCLALPLAGSICTDRRLVSGAQVGEPPGRQRAGRFAKQVDALLDAVLGRIEGESRARR